MKILTQSVVGDAHALAVHWALQEKGVQSELWCISSFPANQTLTVRFGSINQQPKTRCKEDGKGFCVDDFDVIWNRRVGRPLLSSNLHEADQEHAEKECKTFIKNMQTLSAQQSFWVNSPDRASIADNKLLQLSVAQKIGFFIPETIVTNDPDDLKSFFLDFRKSIIIKPFQFRNWNENGRKYISYTAQVDKGLFENPDSIRAATAIYQRKISKQYEVRAFFFGKSYLATKIDSQSVSESSIDWRRKQGLLRYDSLTLPNDIVEKSFEFLSQMGLHSGSIDFIVDLEGDYYFLEINQAGQFLFPEVHNPIIPCLDAFASFLASGDPDFDYKPSDKALSFGKFIKTETYANYKVLLKQRMNESRR